MNYEYGGGEREGGINKKTMKVLKGTRLPVIVYQCKIINARTMNAFDLCNLLAE